MGILDNLVQSGENDIQAQAQNKINSTISKGFNKTGPSNNVPLCPSCKAQLSQPPPRFCPKCGAKLVLTCPKCKKDYPLATKFCPDDGSKLS